MSGNEPHGVIRMEAEGAALAGNLRVASAREGFSGTGYVTGFNQSVANAFCGKVWIKKSGHYNVTARAASDSYKENVVVIDGMTAGTIITEKKEFERIVAGNVYLEEGGHEVGIREAWGWFDLDYLEFVPFSPVSAEVYKDVCTELSNPNANMKTRRVMTFLAENYGKKIIAGQYAGHNESHEIEAIKNATGKYPALRGFDMIFYSPNSGWNYDGEVPLAIDWSRRGGLVSFSWHWHAPSGPHGFYTKDSDFSLRDAMIGLDIATLPLADIRALHEDGKISNGTYRLFSDIDAISEQLKRLQKDDVTVLWRPLHEASGGWFWWGAQGPEPYLWLYKALHKRQTLYHRLDNLIWVWNGQHPDWYPGDEYTDIIGMDIYAEKRDCSADTRQFLRAVQMSGRKKIVALTENGSIPDPDLLRRDGVMWSWFNTWYGTFIIGEDRQLNEIHTDSEMLLKIYNHELVITLDKLTCFSL
jgi:Beta-mannanase